MRTLTFYFDYISNNAYLAWTQLERLRSAHDLDIEPVPVLFAGLLKAHGNVGPAEIPAKRTWMSKNILRKATLLNVPLNPPAFHPFNPLLALRASSIPMEKAQRIQLIDLLFKAVWVKGQHVSEPQVVHAIAEQAGLDGDLVLEQARAKSIAERLRVQTQDALERGVFGIPSMLIDKELFFGYDDFAFVDKYLDNADPLDQCDWQRWRPDLVQPSAQRREAVQTKEK